MIEIKAPGDYYKLPERQKGLIFLAGSIEMGAAERWQGKIIKALTDSGYKGIILNPRRDDWDSSWVQDIKNPQFNEQVNWELDGLVRATTVFFYFDPNTKSPISLMELGLVIGSSCADIIVCCPEGFWRKGNVDILCEKFGAELFTDLDQAIEELIEGL